MDTIKLALQVYNYGNDYIEWGNNHYNDYSLANAVEFSDKMVKEKVSYGDKQYVPHVLRYYLLEVFWLKQGTKRLSKAHSHREENMVMFIGTSMGLTSGYHGVCVLLVGVLNSMVTSKKVRFLSLLVVPIKEFCGFRNVNSGSMAREDIIPAPGGFVFFNWNVDGREEHMGIVEKVEYGTIF